MRPVSYSAHDGSDAVAQFWPMYERQGRRFDGVNGAEYDDLVQEAAIAGWLALTVGYVPTVIVCERACMRYCRSLLTGGWRLAAGI